MSNNLQLTLNNESVASATSASDAAAAEALLLVSAPPFVATAVNPTAV